MKSVLIGIVLMIALGAIAWGILQSQEQSSADAYSSPNQSVRLN